MRKGIRTASYAVGVALAATVAGGAGAAHAEGEDAQDVTPMGPPPIAADVDGDGATDPILLDGGTLRVDASSAGPLTLAVASDEHSAGPRGAHDIDGDGRAEVFVSLTVGANTETLVAVRYDGTGLSTINYGTEPLALYRGGGALQGSDFHCTPGGLYTRLAVREDSTGSFSVEYSYYQLSDNNQLGLVDQYTAVMPAEVFYAGHDDTSCGLQPF